MEEQIILADCLVCEALLTFFQQGFTSYVKGGWRLRQAWKVYQQTFGFILDLYKKTFNNVPGKFFLKGLWIIIFLGLGSDFMKESASVDFRNSVPSSSLPRSASLNQVAQRGIFSYLSSFVSSQTVPE